MDAMGSSHHDGVLVFQRVGFEDLHEIVDILTQDRIGFLVAQTVGGIHDIRAGHTIMHPFLLFTETFGYTACESDDVMAGFLFDFVNSVDGECCILSDFLDILHRDFAELCPCLVDQDFDVKPGLELGLFSPDVSHHFAGITFNHSFLLYIFCMKKALL